MFIVWIVWTTEEIAVRMRSKAAGMQRANAQMFMCQEHDLMWDATYRSYWH